MKRTLRRLGLLLFALAVVAAIVYAFLPKPVEVDLDTVSTGPMELAIEEDGKTRIRDRYRVSAPLAGTLERIRLRRGDPIVADKTVIARIYRPLPELLTERDRAQAEANLKAAQKRLESAKAEHDTAKREHERAKMGAVSPEELDRAALREKTTKDMIAVREYEVEHAEAVLNGDESMGDRKFKPFPIVAQHDGVVLEVIQESERPVAAGTELLTYGDPANLEAIIDVLSTDAYKIGKLLDQKARLRVKLECGDGNPLTGWVEYVEPLGFMKFSALGVEEQRAWVVVNFADHEPREKWKALGDEFRVYARIIIWEQERVLRVPSGAVFRRKNGEHAVFVLDNGKAQLRTITVGKDNGQFAEVVSGLKEGDTVIVKPSDKVQDGVAVKQRGAE